MGKPATTDKHSRMARQTHIVIILGMALILGQCKPKDKDGKLRLVSQGKPVSLRLMTFNILSTADAGALLKGYRVWPARRSEVYRTIDQENPHLLAIQETSFSQRDQIVSRFSHRYEFVERPNISPDSLLLYRREDFDLLERGYWYLEHAADGRIPRVAVWAKLEHKLSRVQLMFVAVHLDAQGAIRGKEIAKILDKLDVERATGAPVFVAGDFNSEPHSDEFGLFLKSGYRDLCEGQTFLTYPAGNGQHRIDHIMGFGERLGSAACRMVVSKNGANSDHWPVVVNIKIDSAEPESGPNKAIQQGQKTQTGGEP